MIGFLFKFKEQIIIISQWLIKDALNKIKIIEYDK